jgi:hypothetical protein
MYPPLASLLENEVWAADPNKLVIPAASHCINVLAHRGLFAKNRVLFVHSSKLGPQTSDARRQPVYASTHSLTVMVVTAVVVATAVLGTVRVTIVGNLLAAVVTMLGRAVAAKAPGTIAKTAIKLTAFFKKDILGLHHFYIIIA